MPEEIMYQRDIREFKFRQRMLIIKNNASLRHMFRLDFIRQFNDRVKQRIKMRLNPYVEPEDELEIDLEELNDFKKDKSDRIII